MRQDEIGRERDQRILDPNSVHTRPGRKIPKENSKKFKKLEKNFSAIFLAKSGMRQAEKERKQLQTPFPLIQDPGEKIPKKNCKKIQKI